MYILTKDKIFITSLVIVYLILSYSTQLILGTNGFIPIISFAIFLILAVSFESFRRLQNQINQKFEKYHNNEYKKIESLFAIFSAIDSQYPLPTMSGYAASPILIKTLISTIIERKPKLIFELGSGVSTIMASYGLKKNNQGHIISLDHEDIYAEISRKNLCKHSLESYATIIHAPLKELVIDNQKWLWYDSHDYQKVLGNQKIDLLLVDGPPWDTQKLARYPAIPLLFDSLSENAVVIIDDAGRKEEQEIINLWTEKYNCFHKEFIEGDRGTMILYKHK